MKRYTFTRRRKWNESDMTRPEKKKKEKKNMNYWTDKEARAENAKKHVVYAQNTYGKEIERSCRDTIIYREDSVFAAGTGSGINPELVFVNEDTVSAVLQCNAEASGKIAVLNFASYKYPGGLFLAGSRAQEECLCMESTLYNTLVRFQDNYYNLNQKALNRALYKNRALYTPDIVFERGQEKMVADVLTCAAPNIGAARKYQAVPDEENSCVLRSRVEFMRSIFEENRVDTAILGAWGCGVFGQQPEEVASVMKDVFAQSSIKQVVFAVLGNDHTADVFRSVFSGTNQ